VQVTLISSTLHTETDETDMSMAYNVFDSVIQDLFNEDFKLVALSKQRAQGKKGKKNWVTSALK
jgi:NH3-dependent NAD+ synthetase